MSELYVEGTISDFNVITGLTCSLLFTEQLYALLALTESCSYYFIHFQSSVASAIMFSAMGGLQKTLLYCQLFEKADSAQDLPLTLKPIENLPVKQ